MPIRQFDHYNIKTSRPEESRHFYTVVLGLQDGAHLRPAVGRAGTWILIGGHPRIHLNFVERDQAAPTGAIDHIGLIGDDYDEMHGRLLQFGVPFDKSENAVARLRQIYVMDPNQVRIEINFAYDPETPGASGQSVTGPRAIS